MIRKKQKEKVVHLQEGRQAASVLATTLLIMTFATIGQASGRMIQHKDLAFPHVVAGPDFESVISLTNRGDTRYEGTTQFWTGQGQDWNPNVNGIRVANSRLKLIVEPNQTKILRIRASSTTAGVALILSHEPAHSNFIEGHLVYSSEVGDYDSVGIAPAVELYRSVVPFEDFADVGLALANSNASRRAAVRLRLIDQEGREVETVTRELNGLSHEAKFLSEIFSAEVGTGKVVIESSKPILATAVTQIRGEISALPMLPSSVTYTVYFRYHGKTDKAEVALWAEGAFVKGYLRFLLIDGHVNVNPATYLLSGTFERDVLRLFLVGAGPDIGGREMINTLKISGFSFDARTFRGGFTRVYPWLLFPFNQILGNYELVRQD